MSGKRTSFSNFDVHAIVKELDSTLSKGTIKNVYEIEDLLVLKINTLSNEKKKLIIKNDSRINLTEFDYPIPQYPSQYITSLRKLLKNRKILTISQHNFDRIIILELSNFEGNSWNFIIELFNKGNFLIIDDKNILKIAKNYKKYRNRDLLPNREYIFPDLKGYNFLTLSQDEFSEIINTNEGEIVRVLARNVNISGLYSEELCLRSSIDKNRDTRELTNEDVNTLFNSLKNLRNQLLFGKINANIVCDNKQNEISVVPFELEIYKKYKLIHYDSYNEAVDHFFSKLDYESLKKPNDSAIRQKISSQQKVLKNQQDYLEELKKDKDQYYSYGDYIYANFNSIQKLFDVILDARKKGYDWDEINERLISARKDIPKDLGSFIKLIPSIKQIVLSINSNEVYLDLKKSLGENANLLYNKGKKAEKKIQGTILAIETTKKKLQKLEDEKSTIETEAEFLIKKPKFKWYEKFRWFNSSDDFLVIAGRDASSNEVIFRKYIDPYDLVFHTNFPRSPLGVIKNPENKEISQITIQETASFIASFSSAWKEGWDMVDIFYVYPNQISKTPPSGEYLPRGSFMITGKKNIVKDAKTEIAIGIDFIELTPYKTTVVYYPQLIYGPLSSIKQNRLQYIRIKPSKNGLSKGKIAKEIKTHFLKVVEENMKKWIKLLNLDDIILVLPPGKSIILKSD